MHDTDKTDISKTMPTPRQIITEGTNIFEGTLNTTQSGYTQNTQSIAAP